MLETLLLPTDTQERCGLILNGNKVVEIKNVADNPVIGYVMNPTEVLEHLTTGNVTGTWHTHPNGTATLSGEDFKNFSFWPDLAHFIIGRRNGKVEVKEYRTVNGALIKCD